MVSKKAGEQIIFIWYRLYNYNNRVFRQISIIRNLLQIRNTTISIVFSTIRYQHTLIFVQVCNDSALYFFIIIIYNAFIIIIDCCFISS